MITLAAKILIGVVGYSSGLILAFISISCICMSAQDKYDLAQRKEYMKGFISTALLSIGFTALTTWLLGAM